MRKRIIICSVTVIMAFALISCGRKNKPVNDGVTTLDEIQSGVVYIERPNATYDRLYFPSKGTVDYGDVPDTPENSRMFWLTEDNMKSVPVFRQGTDKLVIYNSGNFEELQHFERYEYLGYTIGLRNLSRLDSGRIIIPIDPDDKSTCIGSDCDELINLYNEDNLTYVTLEKLGDKSLRVMDSQGKPTNLFTRAGTLKGLTANEKWQADIYAGTKYRKYTFTSNLQVLCSMDISATLDYRFNNSKNTIEVNVPTFFHTGFYNVDGQGFMLYVPKGVELTDNTDYNVDNDATGSANVYTFSLADNDAYNEYKESGKFVSTGGVESETDAITNDTYVEKTFKLEKPGYATLLAKVTEPDSYEGVQPTLSIVIVTPWGDTYQMRPTEDNPTLYTVSYYAHIAGEQCVRYYGLGGRGIQFSHTIQ